MCLLCRHHAISANVCRARNLANLPASGRPIACVAGEMSVEGRKCDRAGSCASGRVASVDGRGNWHVNCSEVARLTSILVILIAALAVGMCPCGLRLVVDRAMTIVASIGPSPTAKITCPACAGKNQSSRSDHNAPDPQRCATAVTSDLPSSPTQAPIVAALPVPFELVIVVAAPVRPVCERRAFLHVGLPEPPTLLNLGCCLNT